MVGGSRNDELPKLSSAVRAVFAELATSGADVPVVEKSDAAPVAFIGTSGIIGGGNSVVVVSLTAVIKLLLAAAQGRSGLVNEPLA